MQTYDDLDQDMKDFFLLMGLRSELPENLSEEGKAKLSELEIQFQDVLNTEVEIKQA